MTPIAKFLLPFWFGFCLGWLIMSQVAWHIPMLCFAGGTFIIAVIDEMRK